MESKSWKTNDSRAVKINFGTLGESKWEEDVVEGCHEAILPRLDRFCGIYGALSVGRRASWSPAFHFSLGKQTTRKQNLPKWL